MKKSFLTYAIIVIVVIGICTGVYFGVTKKYQKSLNNKATELLFTINNLPKIDASLATQPLAEAFIKNFTGENDIDFDKYGFTNTHPGFVKLINTQNDLVIMTYPSDEELAIAKEKNIDLEIIPVVKEGFVFFVNADNPVDSLTINEIQNIYMGKITNWQDVGGQNIDIKAYQRPVNSGSQTGMLNLVMKDKKMMEAPKENLVDIMQEIVNLVSMYNNGENAIGYSYYYYATTMFQTIDKSVASRIKLLKISDIEPNSKNIKNDIYPFTTAYYIVIRKDTPKDSDTYKLINAMLSARGQKTALEAGYIPVK